ncbi:hypothetical protein D9M68_1010010 [compost metagenome]
MGRVWGSVVPGIQHFVALGLCWAFMLVSLQHRYVIAVEPQAHESTGGINQTRQ